MTQASRRRDSYAPGPLSAGPTPADDGYLTVLEVAQQLRVSKMTVYRMINEGVFTAARFGRNIRIPVQDFKKYVAEQTTERVQ